MQIYCDKPVIIRNPNLKNLIVEHRSYCTLTTILTITYNTAQYWKYSFPEYNFSPKKMGCTPENIDTFQVINLQTGETFPMFILVPCGKCELCREKKSREWAFRAVCENVYSTSHPLFITLTYNNKTLPKHGVFKEEIQLFLKRLRIRLDRLHYKHSLRYFCCAEYGSKSNRPHYHLIVWNFPRDGALRSEFNLCKLVEKSWKLGFVYCLPAKKGSISYVMKYMRKTPKILPNMNPCFFLSSRKNGGIGAQYARANKEFYFKNPFITDITVTDPYSGQELTVSLPAYFKRMYFPCKSTLVSKTIRDSHLELCKKISLRYTLHSACNYAGNPILTQIEKSVLKKYYFLKPQICKELIPYPFTYYVNIPYSAREEMYLKNELEIASICRYLILEKIDMTYIEMLDDLKSAHSAALEWKFVNRREMNINEIKYNIIQANKLAQEKEIL